MIRGGPRRASMPAEEKPSILLQGIPASPGIQIGRAVVHSPIFPALGPRRIPPSQVEREIRRLPY